MLKEVAIPDDLQAKNVFIEVIAGGIVRTTTHYANKMLVQVRAIPIVLCNVCGFICAKTGVRIYCIFPWTCFTVYLQWTFF